jgi:transposase
MRMIRERGFPYALVERRRAEKDHESDFADPSGFTTFKTRSGPIKLKKLVIGDHARVLVISEGRVAKERAMDALKEKRYQEEVGRLAQSVAKGNLVLPEKVGRRIGRILQKYPAMAAYYEIVAETDSIGARVNKISLQRKETSQREETILGCYVIETSHYDLEAKQIWDLYTTLHSVERAFRCLKTDLGIRPIHHQLGARTEGHLFISVLAYHLLATIENQLRATGDHRTWATIRNIMSTLVRGTITCAAPDGQAHKIRVTSAMEPEHRDIFERLKIESPFRRFHRKIQVRL